MNGHLTLMLKEKNRSDFLWNGKCMKCTPSTSFWDQAEGYFYHAGDGRGRWRRDSTGSVYCMWPHEMKGPKGGERGKMGWMNVKGQESLCNMRSELLSHSSRYWHEAHVDAASCTVVDLAAGLFHVAAAGVEFVDTDGSNHLFRDFSALCPGGNSCSLVSVRNIWGSVIIQA